MIGATSIPLLHLVLHDIHSSCTGKGVHGPRGDLPQTGWARSGIGYGAEASSQPSKQTAGSAPNHYGRQNPTQGA